MLDVFLKVIICRKVVQPLVISEKIDIPDKAHTARNSSMYFCNHDQERCFLLIKALLFTFLGGVNINVHT